MKTNQRPRLAAVAQAPGQQFGVSREDIARRAYDLFLERGSLDGHDLDDWLAAERELAARAPAARPARRASDSLRVTTRSLTAP